MPAAATRTPAPHRRGYDRVIDTGTSLHQSWQEVVPAYLVS
jgi:hypothetical protein